MLAVGGAQPTWGRLAAMARLTARVFPRDARMLDVGWLQVADRIDAWVRELPQP